MGNTEGAEPSRSPQQVLMQISQGMWVAQAVAAAARLGIADALAQSQPQESTTLARAVGADARALARLLRALASVGVLAEPLPHQYTLTPVGELLRSDIPDAMRDWLIAETDTPHWQAWGQLSEGVRSGQTVVPQLFGMHIYEYYAEHPEDRACFSRAMGNIDPDSCPAARRRSCAHRCHTDLAIWPAPGSEDTELGVLMELEVCHGETEVYPRVQA